MNTLRKTTATVGVAALLAVPTALVVASPASADVERHGSCGGRSTYDFNVDKERGHFEVDTEIERAAAGSRWRVTLTHDGKVFYKKNRTADREGDLDVDRNRPNTAGADVFKFRATNLKSGKVCTARIAVR